MHFSFACNFKKMKVVDWGDVGVKEAYKFMERRGLK